MYLDNFTCSYLFLLFSGQSKEAFDFDFDIPIPLNAGALFAVIVCPDFTQPHMRVKQQSKSYNSLAVVYCDEGYEFQPPPTAPVTSTCLSTKTWSAVPACQSMLRCCRCEPQKKMIIFYRCFFSGERPKK